MNRLTQSIVAGGAGAVTTNVLHEAARRMVPDAPRIDLLGMQAMAKMYRGVGSASPTGKTLYARTLIGDLVSNAGYFSLVGVPPAKASVFTGIALGVLAGVGAVVIPPLVALSGETTSRTTSTQAMTILLYGAGGFVAGLTYQKLSGDDDPA